MGALDGIIQMLLFVCFGVYIVMGLALIGIGVAYMSDVGALGATGTWLLLFGFLMLIVGGVAVYANMNQAWLILFVVELINVVLFLGLYIAIIVVIMMASGSSDPIRKASKEAWADVKPTLTIEGSATAGADGALSDKSYCESDVVVSTACTTFYTSMFTLASSASGCHIGDIKQTTQGAGTTISMALNNCTSMKDWDKCAGLHSQCAACEDACYEQTIQDIKDQIVPASYFVLFLVAYFMVVIVWNNIMIGSEDLEGLTKVIGLVTNGILLLLSLILVGMGGYGLSKPVWEFLVGKMSGYEPIFPYRPSL
jgi:bacterioferritin-associated ferredoxin